MTSMQGAMTAPLPALRCPKCAAEMATYERSGVVVDRCRECRGLYLDRGELERLIEAEGGVAARRGWGTVPPTEYAAPAAPVSPRGDRAEWHGEDDDDRDERRGRGDWRSGDDGRGWDDARRQPPRRRSFLGELLEGFGD